MMNRTLNVFRGRSVRFMVIAATLVVLFVSFILGSVIVKAGNDKATANERMYFTSIVVNEGDTLWNIASEHVDYNHYSSVYEYMNEIIELNHIESSEIFAGKKLLITYYAE